MAARVLLRRRAPLMAATLVSGALIPSVAYAEAPPSDYHSKKPIYDDFYQTNPPKAITNSTLASTPVPSPASETIPPAAREDNEEPRHRPHHRRPTPTDRLAVEIGRARLFLYRQALSAEDAVNGAMDRAFRLEQTFTTTVASLAPPRESGEKLLPGLCYVLVASMAGSIVARNRNLVVRAAAPLALGVGAGWLVVPVTMRNASDLLWRFEQRVPAVADAHLAARDGVQRGWGFARAHVAVGRDFVDAKVHAARDLVEGWVKQGK